MEAEEVILAKGFRKVDTDNGIYYTHNVGNNTFIAIDDRGGKRGVWGYRNGKRMRSSEAEKMKDEIFGNAKDGSTSTSEDVNDEPTHEEEEKSSVSEADVTPVDYYVKLIGEITEKVEAEERINPHEKGYAINMIFNAVTRDTRTALIAELGTKQRKKRRR